MLQAQVLLDARRLIAPIDRRIFGGFLEHVGRAVHGGVYEPGSELSDENGFRRDVISAVRRLGVSAVRYPGGNFASAYDWRDGVGPREQRPQRREPAWEQLEPNTFGTDEFLAWCAQAGVEPILTANLGTGTPEDAAEWVEYCREQATKRRSDGATKGPEPEESGLPNPSSLRRFVASSLPKLWCLGNEMDGPWQIGHTTAGEYARKVLEAAGLMRAVDPDIQLLAAGSSGDFLPTYKQWDREVLAACWEEIDFLGIHRYSHNRDGDTPWFLAEGVAVDRMIEEFAALLREARSAAGSSRPVHLAIDEWNTWYRAKGPQHERGGWRTGAPLLQEGYNLEDALVAGQYLASFIRHADVVKLACLAQIVNALAPIITTPRGILKQTIYHPFALFARHARGHAAAAVVHGPRYHARDRGDVPAIDAAATFDPTPCRGSAAGRPVPAPQEHQEAPVGANMGTGLASPDPWHGAWHGGCHGAWSIFLTNRLVAEPVEVTLCWSDHAPAGAGAVWQLTGDDPKAANTFDDPERVIPIPAAPPALAGSRGKIVLPPLSWTVVVLRAEASR